MMLRTCVALALVAGCSGHGSDQGPSSGRDPDAAAGSIDASAGESTLIVFDNADGGFVWTPTSHAPCCGTEPGVPLDLTLAAGSQTGDDSPSALEFYITWDEANITPGGFYFRPFAGGLRIAAGEPVVLEGGVVGTYTMRPPLAMNTGDTIGPELTWLASAQTVHLADPGGDYPPDHAAFTAGIIGVKFPLDDGVHYGFVDLAWQQSGDYVSNGRHVPVRWGYQTEPDTPLVIPP